MQQINVDDELIAREIAQKLGDTPGVSYSEIANKAIECGKTDLGIRVREKCYVFVESCQCHPLSFGSVVGVILNRLVIPAAGLWAQSSGAGSTADEGPQESPGTDQGHRERRHRSRSVELNPDRWIFHGHAIVLLLWNCHDICFSCSLYSTTATEGNTTTWGVLHGHSWNPCGVLPLSAGWFIPLGVFSCIFSLDGIACNSLLVSGLWGQACHHDGSCTCFP